MNTVEAKKGFKTFLILSSGILAIFGLVKGIPAGYRYFSEAGHQQKYKNLQISSLAPTEITIKWETKKEGIGFVKYGTSPNNLDFSAPGTVRATEHEITLQGLEPQTTYYYKIGLDKNIITSKPFQVTTPAR